MDPAILRAWLAQRQGLDGSLAGVAPATVLERVGWARSVGGANPYLTLFSRAGTDRAAIDAGAAALDLYELPAARGCTYVVPAAHYGLALQVGRGAPEGDLKVLAKLGVERSEIDKLCAAVLDVVGDAPLDPAELKNRLGDTVRNLGEEGRKRGQTTTLPAALGLLQAAGELRRVPVNGRLDQQRYGYVRWTRPSSGLTDDEARAELARLYWSWTGPATLAHFRWFSAFTAAQAKAAIAELDLVEVGALGSGGSSGGLLVLRGDEPPEVPAEPQVSLVAGIDSLVLLRRDHASLLEADVPSVGGVADLPSHAIVDRGEIVGLWEYDMEGERIVWATFDGGRSTPVTEAVERTEDYVRSQLGDARSFSLDSPKARAPRIAAIQAMG
jgi:hypothetical protein